MTWRLGKRMCFFFPVQLWLIHAYCPHSATEAVHPAIEDRTLRGKTQAPVPWLLLSLSLLRPRDVKCCRTRWIMWPYLSSSEIIKSERHLVWTYPERTINRVSPIARPWIDYRPHQKNQWSLGLEQEAENVSPKHGVVSHGDSHLPVIFCLFFSILTYKPKGWDEPGGASAHVYSWGEDTSPSRLKPCPQTPLTFVFC